MAKPVDIYHKAVSDAGLIVAGIGKNRDGSYRADPAPTTTQQQLDQANQIISTTDVSQAALDNFENLRARDFAALLLSDQASQAKLFRAVAFVLLDQVNVLRQWDMSFKAAVAASTSLADLKTRVASLPDLPDGTPANVKNLIQNKLSSGAAD